VADYKELIFSSDFKAYRKRQLLIVVEFIHAEVKAGLSGRANLERLHGALEMASRFLRLPSELVNDDKLAGELDKMIQEDLVSISAYLVRTQLEG
jgi:hypothetical protein